MTNNYDMKMPYTINNFILFNKVVINTSLLNQNLEWVYISHITMMSYIENFSYTYFKYGVTNK